jgi:methionyl-tRNA synthetase
MDLEEQTLEKTGDHCEVCGVKLTPQELQTVLENGGPALCTIHATEAEPALETDELDFDA